MKQLKMYWEAKKSEFPEPYRSFTYRTFNNTQEDIKAWIRICRNGIIHPDEGDDCFIHRMVEKECWKPEDTYIIEMNSEPVATISAIVDEKTKIGDMHMVAAEPVCRGQGIGLFLSRIAAAHFWKHGCKGAFLTTDEFRVAAVKSYLRAGYHPVDYDTGMEERWNNWLTEYKYSNIPFYDEKGNYIKTLLPSNENKKLKVGIFGARRGCAFAEVITMSDFAYVSAVCDMDKSKYDEISIFCNNETKYFTDFDSFINSGMDIVVLTNYFNKHCEFAIKALEKGIHVLSETLPAATMKECVEIVRAVEKSGCKYMLSENYAYFCRIAEMKKRYDEKTLGSVVYGEGEYVHPMDKELAEKLVVSPKHWRALMPTSYYSSHALAPLMYITETTPVSLNAQCIFSDEIKTEIPGEPVKDTASIILCRMNDGSLFRITGWAKFAVKGDWYRVSCSNGTLETVRGNGEDVRVAYNDWSIPKGEKAENVYTSQWSHDGEKANVCGHEGSDYFMVMDFLNCVKNDVQPFFDVYRSCAMSSVGILAWRSCLEHGREYKIPDFKNEADRKLWENDTLSPFDSSYPCTMEKR